MRAILTYHSIDPSGSPISVHPQAFERHVAWLRSGQVRVATIEELVQLPASEDAVAITFDDGFTNFREVAAPCLLADRLPITLFVVSDQVGLTNAWNGRFDVSIPRLSLLDWPALNRLCQEGVTLGAHGRTHTDLSRLDGAAVEDEVDGCADVIEHRIGLRPRVFAYPYGHLNPTVSEIVTRSFNYACTTAFRTLDGQFAPMELPRLDMYYFQRPGQLARWGTPAFARAVKLRHGARQIRRASRDVFESAGRAMRS